MTSDCDLPLSDVIAIGNEHAVPVIVDAAAQLPPVENLWRFTQMGATMAIFSGGKDLRGPQSSGLIVGKRDFVEAIQHYGNPNQAIGRPMKVGKEEMLGLLAAVERYLKLDHVARGQYCETTVANWCAALNTIHGIEAQRDFPNEAGQPLAWCLVTIDSEKCGITRNEVVQKLLDGKPAVSVASYGENQLHLNPMTLQPGEEQIVQACLMSVLNNPV
jgi:L-seryl-tRNA(Ser) seleniumtransferase